MGAGGHNVPTPETVRALALKAQPSPSVTIYMPTHKAAAPPSMREDRLRFKNLSQRAAEIAREQGTDDRRVRGLQRQFRAILDDLEFWQRQTESLVVCANPEGRTVFSLPIDSEEHIAVDARFHLSPVIGLLEYTQPYYVLAVAQKQPAFFKGDMYNLERMDLPLPESTGDALRIDEWKEGALQFHSITEGPGAEWHGQGGAKDRGGDELKFYLKTIDRHICERADTKRPLALAGTSELTEAYRQVSHYPHVLTGHVTNGGNTHMIAATRQKIHKDVIQKRHKQLANTLTQNPARAATQQPAVVDAAEKGNVATLLLGFLQASADTVRDVPTKQVTKLAFPPEEQMTQLDHLAATTWHLGGEIITVDQSLIKPHWVAAQLRH